jgi:predicted AAA+ superfamily ATPase
MIQRQIEPSLKNDFGQGKVIVLLGARQVGKTTLMEA